MRGAIPEFDLLSAAYSPDAPTAAGEYRIEIPGKKVAGYSRIFSEHAGQISAYRRVALIDDDISANAAKLNFCFSAGKS